MCGTLRVVELSMGFILAKYKNNLLIKPCNGYGDNDNKIVWRSHRSSRVFVISGNQTQPKTTESQTKTNLRPNTIRIHIRLWLCHILSRAASADCRTQHVARCTCVFINERTNERNPNPTLTQNSKSILQHSCSKRSHEWDNCLAFGKRLDCLRFYTQ